MGSIMKRQLNKLRHHNDKGRCSSTKLAPLVRLGCMNKRASFILPLSIPSVTPTGRQGHFDSHISLGESTDSLHGFLLGGVKHETDVSVHVRVFHDSYQRRVKKLIVVHDGGCCRQSCCAHQ